MVENQKAAPTPDPVLARRHAVIIGGGITGLAAALVLRARGARVTIVGGERVASAGQRRLGITLKGAVQVRHSHAFLGRLRSLLRERYPRAARCVAGRRRARTEDDGTPAAHVARPEA